MSRIPKVTQSVDDILHLNRLADEENGEQSLDPDDRESREMRYRSHYVRRDDHKNRSPIKIEEELEHGREEETDRPLVESDIKSPTGYNFFSIQETSLENDTQITDSKLLSPSLLFNSESESEILRPGRLTKLNDTTDEDTSYDDRLQRQVTPDRMTAGRPSYEKHHNSKISEEDDGENPLNSPQEELGDKKSGSFRAANAHSGSKTNMILSTIAAGTVGDDEEEEDTISNISANLRDNTRLSSTVHDLYSDLSPYDEKNRKNSYHNHSKKPSSSSPDFQDPKRKFSWSPEDKNQHMPMSKSKHGATLSRMGGITSGESTASTTMIKGVHEREPSYFSRDTTKMSIFSDNTTTMPRTATSHHHQQQHSLKGEKIQENSNTRMVISDSNDQKSSRSNYYHREKELNLPRMHYQTPQVNKRHEFEGRGFNSDSKSLRADVRKDGPIVSRFEQDEDNLATFSHRDSGIWTTSLGGVDAEINQLLIRHSLHKIEEMNSLKSVKTKLLEVLKCFEYNKFLAEEKEQSLNRVLTEQHEGNVPGALRHLYEESSKKYLEAQQTHLKDMGRIDALQSENRELKRQCETLRDTNASYGNGDTNYENKELKSRVGSLEYQLEKCKSDNHMLTRKYKDAKEEISNYKRKSRAHQEELAAMLKEINPKLMEAKVQALEAENSQLVKELKFNEANYEKEIKLLKESKINLENSSQTKFSELHEQLEEMKDRNLEMSEFLSKNKQHLDKFDAQLYADQHANEILSQCCDFLNLETADMLLESLQKMERVVKSMPRIMEFMRDLEQILANGGSQIVGIEQIKEEIQIMAENRETNETMRATLCEIFALDPSCMNKTLFAKAKQLAAMAGKQQEDRMRGSFKQSIVDSPGKTTPSKSTMKKSRGTPLNEKYSEITDHIINIFEINHEDEIIPLINEIYLHIQEWNNFLRLVRKIMGIQEEISHSQCLNLVRHIVEKFRKSQIEGQ